MYYLYDITLYNRSFYSFLCFVIQNVAFTKILSEVFSYFESVAENLYSLYTDPSSK